MINYIITVEIEKLDEFLRSHIMRSVIIFIYTVIIVLGHIFNIVGSLTIFICLFLLFMLVLSTNILVYDNVLLWKLEGIQRQLKNMNETKEKVV